MASCNRLLSISSSAVGGGMVCKACTVFGLIKIQKKEGYEKIVLGVSL